MCLFPFNPALRVAQSPASRHGRTHARGVGTECALDVARVHGCIFLYNATRTLNCCIAKHGRFVHFMREIFSFDRERIFGLIDPF